MRPGGAAGQTGALAPIVRSEQTNGNNGVLSHILHPPAAIAARRCWPPVCMFRYATPSLVLTLARALAAAELVPWR